MGITAKEYVLLFNKISDAIIIMDALRTKLILAKTTDRRNPNQK